MFFMIMKYQLFEPKVSVIIPVFNDVRIFHTLKSLNQQNYENYEVIVIDDCSDEAIAPIVSLFQNIKYIRLDNNQGAYAARNAGIKAAAGEILAFTDSDCILDSNWISEGVRTLLSDIDVGIVAGHIEVFPMNGKWTPAQYVDAVLHLRQDSYCKQGFAATGNLFTWKKIFYQCGFFDGSARYLGDRQWGNQVVNRGYRVVYGESAIAYHPARGAKQLLKKTKNQTIAYLAYKPPTLADVFTRFRLISVKQIRVLIEDPTLPNNRDKFIFLLWLVYLRYKDGWRSLLWLIKSAIFFTFCDV